LFTSGKYLKKWVAPHRISLPDKDENIQDVRRTSKSVEVPAAVFQILIRKRQLQKSPTVNNNEYAT
jgi:hypothetical protein